jgi:hypothetical protein
VLLCYTACKQLKKNKTKQQNVAETFDAVLFGSSLITNESVAREFLHNMRVASPPFAVALLFTRYLA